MEDEKKQRPKRMKDYRQARENRLNVLAPLYKRGWSYRQMRKEVMACLNLPTYSLKTVHGDINHLLREWREERLDNTDEALQLELTRIDDIVREAWGAWDKSKTDFKREKKEQVGTPASGGDGNGGDGGGTIATVRLRQQKEEVVCCGDPRYLEVIGRNLAERRKLLGLYAPETKDITAGVSFTSFLIESGLVPDGGAEETAGGGGDEKDGGDDDDGT